MAINEETMETVTDFILRGSQITTDGDCSHEFKRFLVFGRKAMTNLYSILEAETSLLIKVCIVKAMVFPVVMYGCESWTINKTECSRIDALELWSWRTLWEPLGHQEDWISPEYLLEGLMLKLKLQYFGNLMQRDNSLGKTLMLGKIEGKKRRGWQRMRLLDGITDSKDMDLSKLWERGKDGEAWCATCHGVTKGWTQLKNWTATWSLSYNAG